jgi:hypothetical protein
MARVIVRAVVIMTRVIVVAPFETACGLLRERVMMTAP